MPIKYESILLAVIVTTASAGCGSNSPVNTTPTNTAAAPQAQTTPSKSFTAADIAKLKWIEGSWRGMEGDKPFFETYAFENDTTLVVKSSDGENSKTTRYELKDGEFGNTDENIRSAASEITADHVQFVPVTPGSNSFRFERNLDGTWTATLVWPGSKGRRPGSKVYKMEPWPKK
jgi:predicted small lipoprotein YifL